MDQGGEGTEKREGKGKVDGWEYFEGNADLQDEEKVHFELVVMEIHSLRRVDFELDNSAVLAAHFHRIHDYYCRIFRDIPDFPDFPDFHDVHDIRGVHDALPSMLRLGDDNSSEVVETDDTDDIVVPAEILDKADSIVDSMAGTVDLTESQHIGVDLFVYFIGLYVHHLSTLFWHYPILWLILEPIFFLTPHQMKAFYLPTVLVLNLAKLYCLDSLEFFTFNELQIIKSWQIASI